MMYISALLFYFGWSLIDPVEAWGAAYWGRILITAAIGVVLNSIIEAIRKSGR